MGPHAADRRRCRVGGVRDTSLFTVDRPTTAAVIYAVTAIIGSVLIAGGVYLLHRKDAHASSPGETLG